MISMTPSKTDQQVQSFEPLECLLKGQAEAGDRYKIYQLIERGFAIEDVIKSFELIRVLDDKTLRLKILGISGRTLSRRMKKPKEPLTPEQSSRALQFVEVLAKAETVLGNQTNAEHWMVKPQLGLNGRTPIDLLTNPIGYELVDEFLSRLYYGVYQ
ncbi:type II RES/Xre toxin-antitoxin system antitoxin [Metapseudomonas resinovorans]|uniref:type II RES/Xre toxin-antitoxin system antitoxin n=1 Tax=Metapseudomonas resinovorans TaxID=53412 RepID=UPI0009DC2AC2|nr:antitoxin Xre/MbcA/ParS toxin-binding domain-containing protein [Pseudomonas resinovorans]